MIRDGLHKLRLILAGILVSVAIAGVAQVGGGSGVSAPPFSGDASLLTSGTLPDARLSSNVAIVTAGNVFTATQRIANSAASMEFYETDQPTDNGRWRFVASSAGFYLQTETDAGSPSGTVFNIQRTGTGVDSIALSAGTITANGDEVATQGNIGWFNWDRSTTTATFGGFVTGLVSNASTGLYTIGVDKGDTNYVCTGSTHSTSGVVGTVVLNGVWTATSFSVRIRNSADALSDSVNFSLTCIGT